GWTPDDRACGAPCLGGAARGDTHRARVRVAVVSGAARRRGRGTGRNRRARVGRAVRPAVKRRRRVRAAPPTEDRRTGGRLPHPHPPRRRLPVPGRRVATPRSRLTLWYTALLVAALMVFSAAIVELHWRTLV